MVLSKISDQIFLININFEQVSILQHQHHWCSGNINAFQAFAMSSILVWCILSFAFFYTEYSTGASYLLFMRQARVKVGSREQSSTFQQLL